MKNKATGSLGDLPGDFYNPCLPWIIQTVFDGMRVAGRKGPRWSRSFFVLSLPTFKTLGQE